MSSHQLKQRQDENKRYKSQTQSKPHGGRASLNKLGCRINIYTCDALHHHNLLSWELNTSSLEELVTGAMNTVLLQQRGLHGDSSGILLTVKRNSRWYKTRSLSGVLPGGGRPLPWLGRSHAGSVLLLRVYSLLSVSGASVCKQLGQQHLSPKYIRS